MCVLENYVFGHSRLNRKNSEKNYVWKNLTDRIFFNLTSDDRLVKEHGCMYGWMNGTNSDNAISIQTMATQKMVTQKMVGRNMVIPKLEPGYSEHGLSEPGYSEPWLLRTWLLRSYLEPGYTEHNHFVVFNIGDKSKNIFFTFFLFVLYKNK